MFFLSKFKHFSRGFLIPAQNLPLVWASVWERKCVIFLTKFKHSSPEVVNPLAESPPCVGAAVWGRKCMIFLSKFKHSSRGFLIPSQNLPLVWASVWERKCVIFFSKFKHSSRRVFNLLAESPPSVGLRMGEKMCDFPLEIQAF